MNNYTAILTGSEQSHKTNNDMGARSGGTIKTAKNGHESTQKKQSAATDAQGFKKINGEAWSKEWMANASAAEDEGIANLQKANIKNMKFNGRDLVLDPDADKNDILSSVIIEAKVNTKENRLEYVASTTGRIQGLVTQDSKIADEVSKLSFDSQKTLVGNSVADVQKKVDALRKDIKSRYDALKAAAAPKAAEKPLSNAKATAQSLGYASDSALMGYINKGGYLTAFEDAVKAAIKVTGAKSENELNPTLKKTINANRKVLQKIEKYNSTLGHGNDYHVSDYDAQTKTLTIASHKESKGLPHDSIVATKTSSGWTFRDAYQGTKINPSNIDSNLTKALSQLEDTKAKTATIKYQK